MFTAAPAVSVLLPVYNAAGSLPAALDSLRRQTFDDYEIVAVDDGSSDASPELLQEMARSETRLRVLRQPHAGIVTALQIGLAACRGRYVARMDADDRSAPERLARQAAYLDAHPETAVVGCLVRAFPPEEVRAGFRIYLEWLNSLVSDADIRREMFVESPLAHPSVMFRQSAVTAVGGYQEHGWPEDYDLWLRLYLAGARFAKLPEFLLDWREHAQRLTRTDRRYAVENFLRAKAHYLTRGPLRERQTVIVWGAGMMGRRLSKHLLRQDCPLVAFIDVDPRKIGQTRRGLPILAPNELPALWARSLRPALIAAVGARGARQIIRARLAGFGLVEGQDWWGAA